MLARKRAYPDIDNYGGYGQDMNTGTSAAELHYATVVCIVSTVNYISSSLVACFQYI